ncbi:hypothetical protein [Desulfofustis glycolicus]|nr:hypothetical protein [Desulfofustis glycolicus]
MENDTMEKLVEQVQGLVSFKDQTEVGDLVLIIAHSPQLMMYAQVSSIERDRSKRDEWWIIGLTFLTVPLQKAVWTLRTDQMTGREIFTMGGEKRFFKAVDLNGENQDKAELKKKPSRTGKELKRIK